MVLCNMVKRWKWYRCVDGSVAVYHDNDLCFELEIQEECSDTEINLIVKEFIMANQHMMNDEL